jgi:hypothetical protein
VKRLYWAFGCAGLVSSWACSANPKVKVGGTDVPSGTSAANSDNFIQGDQSAIDAANSRADTPQCLSETVQAEAIGLDMYVMLDTSGSMLDQLPRRTLNAAPTTKWDAVRQSLESFVSAPETAQIGIGLQYFPQVEPGVPFSCTATADCGANGGACTNNVCVQNDTLTQPGPGGVRLRFLRLGDGGPTFCVSNADCPGTGQTCRTMEGECIVPPGVSTAAPNGSFLNVGTDPNTIVTPLCNAQADCAGLPGTICDPLGGCQTQLVACTPTLGCPTGAGQCAAIPYGCSKQTRCDVSYYATPAVPISNAASRTADIVASLANQVPEGLTPTGPALQGALQLAQSWATQHPDRQVVTVLATDGFPTECTPLQVPDIAQLAQTAAGGARPVRTFVVGVFSNADLAGNGQANLDALARAGGTDKAIVVNTAGDVTQDFLRALQQIRDTTVSCEFALHADAALDFDQVNLAVSDATGTITQLLNVGDASACGSDQGWYYQRDSDGSPTQINVCPSTCGSFMAGGIKADLQIGCATRIR